MGSDGRSWPTSLQRQRLFGELGAHSGVLALQELAKRDGTLRVPWERLDHLLGQIAEWLARLLQMRWQMAVLEKLHDVLLYRCLLVWAHASLASMDAVARGT